MGESKEYIRSSDEKGSINISEDVVVVVAAAAAVEVEGVHGLFLAPGKELTNMVGKKGLSKGVKFSIDGDDISIDIFILIELGYSASEVGADVQKAVMSAIEDAVGTTVAAVNVHICGISLQKQK